MPTAPACGSWASPITAESLVVGAVSLGEVVVDGETVWWAESRPAEDGRTVVVADGADRVGEETNVRTLVHEYGGAAWWVADGMLVYSEYADQRLYRLDPGGTPVSYTHLRAHET